MLGYFRRLELLCTTKGQQMTKHMNEKVAWKEKENFTELDFFSDQPIRQQINKGEARKKKQGISAPLCVH
jgi:hypothetical protein